MSESTTTLTPDSALSQRHAPTPNAWRALGGVWRLTARRFVTPRYWLTLVVMLGILVVFSIPAASSASRAATGFLPWASEFYVCFLVPLLAFIGGAGAIRDDLSASSVDYVFTRPVRRPVYIWFRYVTQMACIQINFVFAFAVICGIGMFWNVPGLSAALPRLLLAQLSGITVFTAFGVLCGLLTSRYVIVGLIYGAVVEVGLGNVPTQLNQISLTRHLRVLTQPSISDVTGSVVDAAASGGIVFGVTVLLVGIAALTFSFRELAGRSGP